MGSRVLRSTSLTSEDDQLEIWVRVDIVAYTSFGDLSKRQASATL